MQGSLILLLEAEDSCRHGSQAIRRTRVKVVEMIEWAVQRGNIKERVVMFRNLAELRTYAKEIGMSSFEQEDWECSPEIFYLTRSFARAC